MGKLARHMAAPSRWWCVVLTSSPRGGRGDGERWAGGVAHPRRVFGVDGTATQSPRRCCRLLLRWLHLRLEIDACSKALTSSTTLVWRCGQCYRGEGVEVGADAARTGQAFSTSGS
jgi:hypothetical protein